VITNLLLTAPTVDTLTAIRIVVDLTVYSGSANEDEYEMVVDFGIGVSSAEAFAVGVTALPDPNTVGDYPPRGWLFVGTKVATQIIPGGATPGAMWVQRADFKMDLRASRRIDKGVLFAIFRNGDIAGSKALSITGRIRALCLT